MGPGGCVWVCGAHPHGKSQVVTGVTGIKLDGGLPRQIVSRCRMIHRIMLEWDPPVDLCGFGEPTPTANRQSLPDSPDQLGMGPTMKLCWFGEAAPTDNRKSSLDSPGLTWNGTHNEFVLVRGARPHGQSQVVAGFTGVNLEWDPQ